VTAELLTAIFTGVQAVVVALTLIYVGCQVHDGRVAAGFQAYSHVSDAYMRHLWLAAEKPELNSIWEPETDKRREELDSAQAARPWGAWHEMGTEEKRAYRYTRAALAIFEQAWEVERRGLIGEDTWSAWNDWLDTWKGTPYYRYVVEDNERRLLTGFYEIVKAPPNPPQMPAASPSP
jgi:hypothetical protein